MPSVILDYFSLISVQYCYILRTAYNNMDYCESCSVDTSRNEYIQCYYCKCWTHITCNGLNVNDLKSWAPTHLKFACQTCAFTEDGSYDVSAALARLTIARLTGRRNAVNNQALAEKKLLSTYKVNVSYNEGAHSTCDIDEVASSIIGQFDPSLADEHSPLKTIGDGNCLYRAVSLALTGTQDYHLLLRLMTAIELVLNRDSYDTKKKHNDFLNDIRIVTSPYEKLVSDAVQESCFSEMGHMYALSAALTLPLRTYFPSIRKNELSDAFTRVVVGRDVEVSEHSPLFIMWSSASVPDRPENFKVNHFVPLIPKDTILNTSNFSFCEQESVENDEVLASRVDEVDMSEFDRDFKVAEDDDPMSETKSTDFGDVDVELEDSNSKSDSVDRIDESVSTTIDSPEPDETTGYLENSFLNTDKLIKLLKSEVNGRDAIPGGLKENVYFVLDNTINANVRKSGKHSEFPDDCGIWDATKGSTPKTYYVLFGHSYKQAWVKNNYICYRKKVKGQTDYFPYDPQPDSCMVYPIHRYYTTSKKDPSYKKRVTWLGESCHTNKLAIAEYLGTFPGLVSHGNSTTGKEYHRVPPKVLDEITELTGKMKPHQIFNKLTDKHDDLTQPTCLRQIHDRQYRDRQKGRNTEGHKDNFADQIRQVENMVTENSPFVRSVIRTSGRTPSIVLFTDDQITDLKNMCCTGQTVLGIDKTFMLCKMHVTVTCYKQLTIEKIKTGQNPIFLGPIFIHDNSDFETFSHFLYQLKLKLYDVPHSKLVIGSDDEKALVKAIETVFPNATHVLCTRHLEENARHLLTDDAVTKTQKQRLMKLIFGDGGLLDANDSVCYDDMAHDIDQEIETVSQKFHQYFNKRLLTTLKTKVNDPLRANKVIKRWTNNNCESMNHVLKQTVDWKSQPLPDLVCLIHDLVNGQFKRLRGALIQNGDYRLADTHRQFERTKTDWIKMTDKQRLNYYRRYRNFVPKENQITSTDGKTTVMAPKTNGRKPGQTKRKAKTLTLKGKKLKTEQEPILVQIPRQKIS